MQLGNIMERKKGYLCYMKRGYSYQTYILLLAVALYLYFWQGWIAVGIYLAVVALLLLSVWLLRRKSEQRQSGQTPTKRSVKVDDLERRRVERRKEQSQKVREFIVAVDGRDLGMDRVAKRLVDWHLEYSRMNGYHHTDLYDFILDRCKERLSSAEAAYLRRELRQTIEIIRRFMRGQSVEQVVSSLKDKTD